MENFDYRIYLREELEARVARNSRYSLRAFARDLGMDPASLGLVLRGEQGLSRATAQRIARKLGLNGDELRDFVDRVDAQHARSEALRRAARGRLENRPRFSIRTLSPEEFEVISEWPCAAVYELVKVRGFRAEAEWIARRLGIEVKAADRAWRNLHRLGLVAENAKGKWTTVGYVATSDGKRSAAGRRFNADLLERAGKALDTQSLDERYIASITFALGKEQIPTAQKLLQEMRRDFVRKVQRLSGESRDRVYAFSVQLFGLDTGVKDSP